MSTEFREVNVLDPDRRAAIEHTISHAIGERPGRWIVDLFETHNPDRLAVKIIGPNEFGIWRKSFRRNDVITLGKIKNAVLHALSDRLAE